MSAPKTRVRRVKVTLDDHELRTRRRRGVAWKVECDCGVMPWRFKTRAEAVAQKDAHLAASHASPRVTLAGPL